MDIKERLDAEVVKRNAVDEISEDNLDPILVAKRHNDETIALICALFVYGNVKQIVKFLDSLDFRLLNASDEEIRVAFKSHYYRFQKSEDVIALFIALKSLNATTTIKKVFKSGYAEKRSVVEGINRADLIMPLDTHTFKIGHKLGLLKRKSYDLEAAIELTETLKGFDKSDPLKYDFALYRLGQEGIL